VGRVGKQGGDTIDRQWQRKAGRTVVAGERQEVVCLRGAGDDVEPLVEQHDTGSWPLGHVRPVQQRVGCQNSAGHAL
jgi:hypothetical protein